RPSLHTISNGEEAGRSPVTAVGEPIRLARDPRCDRREPAHRGPSRSCESRVSSQGLYGVYVIEETFRYLAPSAVAQVEESGLPGQLPPTAVSTMKWMPTPGAVVYHFVPVREPSTLKSMWSGHQVNE